MASAPKRPLRIATSAPAPIHGDEWGWFAQATSYWDTDALFREFCGAEPA